MGEHLKVVILAGGFGTRLSEYTDVIPKPMVTIGGLPILWHIMKSYAYYGHSDFLLALGYKSEVIKDYFLRYNALNANFRVNLATGKVSPHEDSVGVNWDVTLVNTGLDAMTGGRLKRLKQHIGNETFLMTYGDGLSDVDINSLIDFHKSHGKLVTVTAVHPAARFGEIDVDDSGQVKSFLEKPQTKTGWINGGFFVIEPGFLDFIDGDDMVLEREPLERAARLGQLMAFKHEGSWQCVDTKRDKDMLEKLWDEGEFFWQK